ncbi:MAG TPA: deoxyhypusine synthase [Thermoplasmata archaeon]|nr:deoxyhypusine synthase [Thermoplasmata archaeon]
MKKENLMNEEVKHADIKSFDSTPIIDAFEGMAFQARNLVAAAKIYDRMISDSNCTIILCLSGSLFSAGLKKVVSEMVQNNMVDVIVSTGAIVVDPDFFEALGFRHCRRSPLVNDEMLNKMGIDRIYDTFIDENQLRECGMVVAKIADYLPPRPYSSREFIWEMGKYLSDEKKNPKSVVLECYKKGVPIFVPAFSDCSAGFGLVYHQRERGDKPKVAIDSVRNFLELTKVKARAKDTGLVMVGWGVPKNFAQDVTIATDILGDRANMHKYAIQITLADERDGGLSGSIIKEGYSWGKVDRGFEQMVFCEATIAFLLIASYAYHRGNWKKRSPKNYDKVLAEVMK